MFKRATIFLIIVLIYAACTPQKETRLAKGGVMDLTDYDLRSGELVALKGEWLIYWDQFLLPGDSAVNPGLLINVPRRWNNLPWAGGKLPIYGKATYQLTLKLNPQMIHHQGEASVFGLKIKDIHSAYRVFINGRHYLDKGNVGAKPTYKAVLGHEAVFFEADTSVVIITIQVANYSDPRQAGMDENITLGPARYVEKNQQNNNNLYMLAFGILFILFFYHLMLYLFRRREKVNLYFAILCLVLSIQSLFMGGKAIYFLLPNLDADLYIRIFMSSLVVVAFVFLYYGSLLPKEFPRKLVKGVTWFYGVMTVYFLVQPFNINIIGEAYYAIAVIMLLYVLIAICVGVVKKREHAVIILIGAAFAILTGINDLLHALEIIYTGYYAPIGFIAYTFSQSILMSYKFSQSFTNAEKLSNELELLNQHLEGLVAERTEDLDEANQNLIKSNATKDRFFSIIAHDLRGPIGTVTSLLETVISEASDYPEEKRKELLQQVYNSIEKTYKLLENLLIWARSQQGDIPYDPGTVRIAEIINQVESLLIESAHRKGIEMTCETEDDYKVFCDANMIQTVMRNLVSNAIKFTGENGKITIRTSLDEDGKVLVSVSDTGTGMPEAQISHLLKIDEKYKSTKGTGGEPGTGLGLIISSDFLDKNGSRLQVKSAVNSGSTFSFSLTRILE
jgi:two-component system sensor histidine kinase ChiS